jgi:hypothetical protein
MVTKLVRLKKNNGDVFHVETEAGLVIRGASTVDADLTAVEDLASSASGAAATAQSTANTAQSTANAAIPSAQKGAASGVATLGTDGKIPVSQLPSEGLTQADVSVADITALLALSTTDAPLNTDAFVNDASADATVGSGWALYRRTATAGGTLNDWTKLAEGEGLDVAFVDDTARAAAEAAQTAADSAQEDVDSLATTVTGLGTVYFAASTDDLSGYTDTDLILQEIA